MKSSRREMRIIAFQLAYQQKKIGASYYTKKFMLEDLNVNTQKNIIRLLSKLKKKQKKINQLIQTFLVNWKQDRISTSLNIILQLAIAERMMSPKLAKSIIINEYLEITRMFSGEKAVKFCNGVLSNCVEE